MGQTLWFYKYLQTQNVKHKRSNKTFISVYDGYLGLTVITLGIMLQSMRPLTLACLMAMSSY